VRVLVDMDGVLTDFESGFLDRWRELYADRIFIPLSKGLLSTLRSVSSGVEESVYEYSRHRASIDR